MKTMKLFLVVAFCAMSLHVAAQGTVNPEVTAKASKMARKAAKDFKKEGWQVSPGAPPLEKQLDRAYAMEYDMDDDLNPKYIVGEGRSIGENYDAAKMQAIEVARQQIAGKISSQATALVDNLMANKQLPSEQATSISTMMQKTKTIFSQKLGRVQTIVEAYRVLGNKNKEVLVRLVTKESEVQKIAKGAIREEMEKQGVKMTKELDALLTNAK